MAKITTIFLLTGLISAAGVYFLFPNWIIDPEPIKVKSFEWWGRGKAPAGAEKAAIISKPFKIQVKESEIEDLKRRLASTRYSEPLENVNFNYGFPGDQLKKVVDYWANKYDWSIHQAALNKYSHFKANIEGIDVHYMRATPTKVDKNIKVLPLMLIHGWPGSVVEFLKIIPLLTTPKAGQDFVFDVICPSIPGYGYSEAPHQAGFNAASAARIFNKLMLSLKFDGQYYLQGGDWGSLISQAMSILYPENVRGLHLNMANPNMKGVRFILTQIVGSFKPELVLDEGQSSQMFPFSKFFGEMMLEMGYMHIQATKPDTVGSALTDSPAGLAAYILEKFSTWVDPQFRDLPDGGLTRNFKLDELLTNVMVYWTTNSITSSQRFYKENMKPSFRALDFEGAPIFVPSGIASFRNEILTISKFVAKDKHRKLVTFNHYNKGGHFAAFEVPDILAQDIITFVKENEKLLAAEKAKLEESKKKA